MNLSQELQVVLSIAINEATARGHEFIGLEHLLYALCRDPRTAEAITGAGGDLPELSRRLEHFLHSSVDVVPPARRRAPQPTRALQRVMARAEATSRGAGKREVSGSDVLIAMFAEAESWAVHFMEDQGVTRLDVVSWVTHGVAKADKAGGKGPVDNGDEDEEDRTVDNALASFATDLCHKSHQGLLDPMVGREAELDRVIHVLARRRKNNPMLVGGPGVGKTAIAEGLAQRIAFGNVPPFLRGVSVHSLDLGALVAGTRYRGDFENRMKALIDQVKASDGRIMLFIDEIHQLLGAGAVSGGAMDAANLLKPGLADGSIRCVGATTHEEYRKHIEKDAALARRFQMVEVAEPDIEGAIGMLDGLLDGYTAHHRVIYSPEAVKRAAVLADRHIRDRLLPGKAVDVLDEAGASVKLDGRSTVTVMDIEGVVSRMAGVPVGELSPLGTKRISELPARLREGLFGQDAAVDRLLSTIMAAMAGLGSPEHPMGSFLMVGPTGVGKTELARQLASALGMRLIRFDMSEYGEKHTVSRLVGAPPGYVGFEQQGLLVNAVRETPHAVVLLDEIEKAHPDVFGLLLQIMDYGTLTDASGKRADFRHSVLLMTSNIGAGEKPRQLPGFSERVSDPRGEALEGTFRPEFRNRLDGVLKFDPLTRGTMLMIADKFLSRLSAQMDERGLKFSVSAGARTWLADMGYDPQFGARPMERLIRERIAQPLAAMVVSGTLPGKMVKVDLGKDGPVVKAKRGAKVA